MFGYKTPPHQPRFCIRQDVGRLPPQQSIKRREGNSSLYADHSSTCNYLHWTGLAIQKEIMRRVHSSYEMDPSKLAVLWTKTVSLILQKMVVLFLRCCGLSTSEKLICVLQLKSSGIPFFALGLWTLSTVFLYCPLRSMCLFQRRNLKG